MTEEEAKKLIEEIRIKFNPDFYSIKEIGGKDGRPNEIEMTVGWNVQE